MRYLGKTGKMMNNKLFGISTPFEDAKKLDREYKRLLNSSNIKGKQDQSDHALNFSLTAWHLADKVFNYPYTHNALKEKGIDTWKAFLDYIYSLCPELKICYALSINYKHSDNDVTTVNSATQVSEIGIAKFNGVPIDKIAKINGVPIEKIAKIHGVPLAHDKLIVETPDGTNLNFIDVANAVNAFWQKELESLQT